MSSRYLYTWIRFSRLTSGSVRGEASGAHLLRGPAGRSSADDPGILALIWLVFLLWHPQEASVVDALASFGVVHADMPLTLACIWLAVQGPACSEGRAPQCFPLNR